MPSQLINNEAVYFIAARPFTYDGKDYKIGQKFDQDAAKGRIDLLVRTRRVIAVVDNRDDKPRHWHHHVWVRSDLDHKLGLLRKKSDELEGESLLNKPRQMAPTSASGSASEEVRDDAQAIWDAQQANIIEEQKNEENDMTENSEFTTKDGEPVTIDGVKQTEPLDRVEPSQGRDISDLHEDVQTGGDYSPHDGEVSEEKLTKNIEDDSDDDKSEDKPTAAKKTTAKKTTTKKKS